MTYCYKVAGFTFAVVSSREDIDVMLPSFAAFRTVADDSDGLLFRLEECLEGLSVRIDAEFLDEDVNDMGHTRLYRMSDGYRVELRYRSDGVPHVLETDMEFRLAKAHVVWEDRYAGLALCSMLRIVFAQAVLPYGAVSLHASVVMNDGQGFVFMGKSGTGKSTHSSLWMKAIEGTELLNDDNPIVRLTNGGAVVYGSPWSGKTPCYRNEGVPVAGMVRLVQAPANMFRKLEDVEAFGAVLAGCSVLRQDKRLHDALCATLVALSEAVSVGELKCLPDEEAARLCREALLRI